METFTVAAVSLAISIALIIKSRNNPLYLLFAFLCFALFSQRIGLFLHEILNTDYWRVVSYAGALSIPPLMIVFTRSLLGYHTFLSKRDILLTTMISVAIAMAAFTPLSMWSYFHLIISLYAGFTLVYCYGALTRYVTKESPGPVRKRMIYVAVACFMAAVLSLLSVLRIKGYDLSALPDIALALLLYFLYMVVTHTDLPHLHGTLIKTFLIAFIIVFSMAVFYGVFALFGSTVKLPIINVLVASFLIVVLMEPVTALFKKIFSFFFIARGLPVSFSAMDDEADKRNFSLLEEMATGLAHEIRNPLGSIKGAAQYLKAEADTTGSTKLIDIIIDETDRLNTVVSQFLNYARPHIIHVEKQDMNRIVRKVISLIKAKNLPENITIEEHLADKLPDVKVDGEQMIQVFLNVALNGIEAMPEGGTLQFRTSRRRGNGGKSVEIVIRDTGRGISQEDTKRIFKPFFTTKRKGTGLGLAICQKIIKNHGGHIHVESNPGVGTAFFIRI